MNNGPDVAHQLEDFKEVQVGVEDVLNLLQPLLAQGAHGVANSVEAHAAGEDDEALEQGLAAGDVFELQVRDAIGELAKQKNDCMECWCYCRMYLKESNCSMK